MKNISAVILAGGKGSRMQSELPKVLHQVGGKPMIHRNIEKLKSVGLTDFVVVVGYKSEQVKESVSEKHEVKYAFQEIPMGTNHALETALKEMQNDEFEHVFVINGDDAALYNDETIKNYIQSHIESNAAISMMTLMIAEENALGRVMRDEQGNFNQIMEAFEYVDSGLKSDEINCGVYIFDGKWVMENISIVPLNKKGEYPITDLLNIAKDQNKTINLFLLPNPAEWVGVNTPEELEYANSLIS